MNKYIPFLKLKRNEIQAIRALDANLKRQISVFFEIPRSSDPYSVDYDKQVYNAAKSVEKNCCGIKEIYLDTLDIPSDAKEDLYDLAIDTFNRVGMTPIPVIGIDRTQKHVDAALKNDPNVICLRILPNDFCSFELFITELAEILDVKYFTKNFDIVYDLRYCSDSNENIISQQIVDFHSKAINAFIIRRVIITGSSIPPFIGQILQTESDTIQDRKEIKIFNQIATKIERTDLYFGDYAITTPIFVDPEIQPELFQNVITPRIIYSFDNSHFIIRGGALKTHPRKRTQYNDFCYIIYQQPFFRGNHSWGDDYIESAATDDHISITPSTIIKPATNSHITYMLTK